MIPSKRIYKKNGNETCTMRYWALAHLLDVGELVGNLVHHDVWTGILDLELDSSNSLHPIKKTIQRFHWILIKLVIITSCHKKSFHPGIGRISVHS
jgi:hypothetical protein